MEVVGLPMQGEIKLRREGARTRDLSLLSAMADDGIMVTLVSRPEPFPRLSIARIANRQITPSFHLRSTEIFRPSRAALSKHWWYRSLSRVGADALKGEVVVAFAPPLADHALQLRGGEGLHFDVLDNWLEHPAFTAISRELDRSYRRLFDEAEHITVNSERNLEFATKHGRTDARLVRNGCYVSRFEGDLRSGGSIVVGYGAKFDRRTDWGLISDAAAVLPWVTFKLCGPAMSREGRRAAEAISAEHSNVEWLRDLDHRSYALEVTSWDVGWVPHHHSEGEVGGDLMKIYEYAAAGLPILLTDFAAAFTYPGDVTVASRREQVTALEALAERALSKPLRCCPADIDTFSWQARSRELRVPWSDEQVAP